MTKINTLFIAAVAAVGVLVTSSDCSAQSCNSCGTAGSNVDATFGFPSSGTVYNSVGDGYAYDTDAYSSGGRFGQGERMQNLKSKYHHAEVNAARVIARNEAWPMPFNCASRQLYFTFWEPMIDQGFEEQCVLTSAHFDDETGELNSFGKHTVAGIMQNMPTARRKVFIHREVDVQANENRIANVRETINTFYGQSGPAIVQFSSKLPVKLRGTTAEAIFKLGSENQPTPIIPISSGAQSVGSSVGN